MTNQSIKTHEQHTLVHESYVVVASFDLTGDKVRITLSKPDGFGSNMSNLSKGRDYHFEQSQVEAVNGFAVCAAKAVEIAKRLQAEKAKPKAKKAVK